MNVVNILFIVVVFKIGANEQGLLLCWYFIMTSPEPLLI
jgi:hypothetical protein